MVDFTQFQASIVKKQLTTLAKYDIRKGYGLDASNKMHRFPRPVNIIDSNPLYRGSLKRTQYCYNDDSMLIEHYRVDTKEKTFSLKFNHCKG